MRGPRTSNQRFTQRASWKVPLTQNKRYLMVNQAVQFFPVRKIQLMVFEAHLRRLLLQDESYSFPEVCNFVSFLHLCLQLGL